MVCSECMGLGILPNIMNAPDGPECACGGPSRHANGWCGENHGPIYCNCTSTSEKSKACPCFHVTPCQPNCTCVNPFMSHGCHRCCTYGSEEQQKAKAEYLVKALENQINEQIINAGLQGSTH